MISNSNTKNENDKYALLNMSTDINLMKDQLSKIIQSGRFCDKMMSNLDKKTPLLDLAVPLCKEALPKLATNLGNKGTSPVLDIFERKISWKGAVKAGKRFTFIISNEDNNDNIKIVDSRENSGLLIDGATETVKHEIRKQEGGFLGAIFCAIYLLYDCLILSIHWYNLLLLHW